MAFAGVQKAGDRLGALVETRWRTITALFWIGAAAWMVWQRWWGIHWFALGDTDDNMRMMQVRALLEGQGWYDLRQYRMSAPQGLDIHWSRLVDLPIAGIKLLLTPFMGGAPAERVAVTLAPMLPLAVVMTALAVTARRLVSPYAYPIALALLLCGASVRNMFMPLRIDHHGWQLAMVALCVMALSDPKRARGGALLGVATALSLTIGLEMLLYLAVAGAVAVFMWIWNRDEARRLFAYGASLAGGCALSYLLFTSEANRAAVCDALSPVWLSAMILAGALSVALAAWSPEKRLVRFAAAAAGGIAVGAAFGLMWPHCLGRLEQSSPELERLWLSRVREAMPIWRHGWKTAANTGTLPVLGLIGYLAMNWRSRRGPDRLLVWTGLFLLGLLATALLAWQTRAGPAAQLLSVTGATALAWLLLSWLYARRSVALAAAGVAAAVLLFSGYGTMYALRLIPEPPAVPRPLVESANRRCPTMPALRPIARQPKGNVLTFVDLGPRLITVTHHNAITGPYHRNAQQILDIMLAFRGTPERALETVDRYRIDYVLICPHLSESTVYAVEAPNGFYRQLMRNEIPAWLERVPLPADSPYRMWRVVKR
ncbi:MAG TPA: AcrB/AcrD/AcrF family protein [Allosphingosinicella sp.]|nr:AcrB/AcrD/AcrF family protein [Allosphingosinicella sp.]